MKRGTRYLSTIILFLTLTLLVIPLSLTQEIESLTDERIETISVKEMLTIPDSVKEQTNFENILRINKNKANEFTKAHINQLRDEATDGQLTNINQVSLDEDIFWENNLLKSRDQKSWLDIETLPKGLTEIEHKEGQFILTFENGRKYIFSSGSINEQGIVLDENGNKIEGINPIELADQTKIENGKEILDLDQGSITFDGEKFSLEGNAQLSVGENQFFRKKDLKSPASIYIIEEEGRRYFLAHNVVMSVNNNLISIPSIGNGILGSLTNIFIGPGEFNLGLQGIQMDPGKLIKMTGEDIEVTMAQDFDEVTVKESGLGDLIVKNGEMDIVFRDQETLFSRQPSKAAEFAIGKLHNANLNDNDYFKLGVRNGEFKLIDRDYYTSMGSLTVEGILFRRNSFGTIYSLAESSIDEELASIKQSDYSSYQDYRNARDAVLNRLDTDKIINVIPKRKIVGKELNKGVFGLERVVGRAYSEVDQEIADGMNSAANDIIDDPNIRSIIDSNIIQDFMDSNNFQINDLNSMSGEQAREYTVGLSNFAEQVAEYLPQDLGLSDAAKKRIGVPRDLTRDEARAYLTLNNNRDETIAIADFIERGSYGTNNGIKIRLDNGVGIIERNGKQHITSGKVVNAMIILAKAKYPEFFNGHRNLRPGQAANLFGEAR
tara:strand:+ start:124 stop:2112 length:1989 start_codon:yes stop_codon:yes gene_type:complete